MTKLKEDKAILKEQLGGDCASSFEKNFEVGTNKDIYLGLPVKLGKYGIEEIIELKLNEGERKLLADSAVAVKEVMDVYDGMVSSSAV